MKKIRFLLISVVFAFASILPSCQLSQPFDLYTCWLDEQNIHDEESIVKTSCDKNGLTYILTKNGHCFVAVDEYKCALFLKERNKEKVTINVPSKYLGHTIDAVSTRRFEYGLLDDCEVTFNFPNSIRYFSGIDHFMIQNVNFNIPNSVVYIRVDIPDTELRPSLFTEYENGVYIGPKNNPFLCLVRMIDYNATEFVVHKDCRCVSDWVRANNIKFLDLPKNLLRFSGTFEGVESITIPKSVVIFDASFGNSLENITIENGVKYFGYGLSYCDRLESVEIPDSVLSIERKTFEECESLKTLKIGKGVTYLPDWLCYYCPNLKTLILSNGIKEICDNTLITGCESLTEIVFLGTTKEWTSIRNSDIIKTDHNYLQRVVCEDGIIKL